MTETTMSERSRRLLVSVLASLMLIVALVVASPTSAHAATPAALAPAPTVVAAPMSAWDCVSVARNVWGSPYQKVRAAVNSWGCGSWLGTQNADFICWSSNQWWGSWARWAVWVITGGQYTRC